MLRVVFTALFASSALFSPVWAADAELSFQPRLLAHDANEGIAVGDIDGDGKPDLVAGRNWYRGGDWTPRPVRTIEDWNGYVESNGDFLFDVNGDDRLDVISQSFLPTKIHWYENPGAEGLRLGRLWKKHELVDTKISTNENELFEDLDGDGRPEWVVDNWLPNVPAMVWRLVDKPSHDGVAKDGGATIEMKPHQLGKRNGHGLAIGDINGDTRKDILYGDGWYEQPEDTWGGPWKFHADWSLHSSIPMIVTDLDKDGDGDLIYGNGHTFGLFWWQNDGPDSEGKIQWTEHEIDKSYSQPHCLAWRDLDGDGAEELITGKRYYAHNGSDPGGNEMPCLYYYKWDIKSKSFSRHTIEEGHVGTGLQIVTADLNGDSKTDIAVAGKSGTYLLLAQ